MSITKDCPSNYLEAIRLSNADTQKGTLYIYDTPSAERLKTASMYRVKTIQINHDFSNPTININYFFQHEPIFQWEPNITGVSLDLSTLWQHPTRSTGATRQFTLRDFRSEAYWFDDPETADYHHQWILRCIPHQIASPFHFLIDNTSNISWPEDSQIQIRPLTPEAINLQETIIQDEINFSIDESATQDAIQYVLGSFNPNRNNDITIEAVTSLEAPPILPEAVPAPVVNTAPLRSNRLQEKVDILKFYGKREFENGGFVLDEFRWYGLTSGTRIQEMSITHIFFALRKIFNQTRGSRDAANLTWIRFANNHTFDSIGFRTRMKIFGLIYHLDERLKDAAQREVFGVRLLQEYNEILGQIGRTVTDRIKDQYYQDSQAPQTFAEAVNRDQQNHQRPETRSLSDIARQLVGRQAEAVFIDESISADSIQRIEDRLAAAVANSPTRQREVVFPRQQMPLQPAPPFPAQSNNNGPFWDWDEEPSSTIKVKKKKSDKSLQPKPEISQEDALGAVVGKRKLLL